MERAEVEAEVDRIYAESDARAHAIMHMIASLAVAEVIID